MNIQEQIDQLEAVKRLRSSQEYEALVQTPMEEELARLHRELCNLGNDARLAEIFRIQYVTVRLWTLRLGEMQRVLEKRIKAAAEELV